MYSRIYVRLHSLHSGPLLGWSYVLDGVIRCSPFLQSDPLDRVTRRFTSGGYVISDRCCDLLIQEDEANSRLTGIERDDLFAETGSDTAPRLVGAACDVRGEQEAGVVG
jgi:hypothetical protein